ncbi:hypothetical protein J5N97_017615 [Dioscorea zingiberensis]|uniref:Uncharacterized protein n=1 Tax=Dioscorea zingiberensis TaxID=325984 RepID=A0A9D5CLZ9_9LILI|nr:hypothetical protein J5N97_017615 [Dioscorea zingiberensis]
MIILNPMVHKVYVEAHPTVKPFINKPLDNYKGLEIISSPPPFSTIIRPTCGRKRSRESDAPIIGQLVDMVEVVEDAIKNPTHWTEIRYKRVMELDGFVDGLLEDVFDYLQVNVKQARSFMAKKKASRKAWIENFNSPMMP